MSLLIFLGYNCIHGLRGNYEIELMLFFYGYLRNYLPIDGGLLTTSELPPLPGVVEKG